jgi:hypothetical protein
MEPGGAVRSARQSSSRSRRTASLAGFFDLSQPATVRCGTAHPSASGQMLNEPDASPLRLADQLGKPPLALQERQAAQIVTVMLDQIKAYSTTA